MAIKWKTKILLADLEATYGTSPGLAAANGVLAKDISLSPMEGDDEERDLELPYFGSQGTIPTGVHSKISFSVELAPSGTAGTAPAWGKFLRMCGVAQTVVADTSVTYNPVTDGHESGAISLQIDGTLFQLLGARGTCVIDFVTQKIPLLNFTFTGLFVRPVEATRVLPTSLGDYKKPLIVSDTNTPAFTLGGTDMVLRSCKMDLGNTVETSFLVGSESVEITDKMEAISATVRAVPITTLDPYGLAIGMNDVALVLTHGITAGAVATLSAPQAQMQRPAGLENAQNLVEWPLSMVPRPSAGNDQWTLTLT